MKIQMRLPIAVIALWGSVAFGQATNSADVTGTVTDPSGAVVPGVTITIKDVDKGSVRTTTTSGAGLYDSGPLIANDGSVLGMVFATALDSSDTGYALTAGQLTRDVSSGRRDSAPVGTGSCTPE